MEVVLGLKNERRWLQRFWSFNIVVLLFFAVCILFYFILFSALLRYNWHNTVRYLFPLSFFLSFFQGSEWRRGGEGERESQADLSIYLSIYLFRGSEWRRGGEGERESQAGFMPIMDPDVRLNTGLKPMTMGSWPEPKSRVRRSMNWATQAPNGVWYLKCTMVVWYTVDPWTAWEFGALAPHPTELQIVHNFWPPKFNYW